MDSGAERALADASQPGPQRALSASDAPDAPDAPDATAVRPQSDVSHASAATTLRALAGASEAQQCAALGAMLRNSPAVCAILKWAREQALPEWYLGAGGVAQTVWNHAHGFAPEHAIKDYDLVYFDPRGLSRPTEERHQARARQALKLPVDVTNEARVHLWYPQRFGRTIEPYPSVEAAIATWPTTASSIGVRLTDGGLRVCAPFGLRDLLALIVRPNKAIVPRSVYEAKVARWLQTWPGLTVEPW